LYTPLQLLVPFLEKALNVVVVPRWQHLNDQYK